MKSSGSIRVVAIFEALKGAIVIVAGFGLLSILHHDAQHVVERLVRHLHLNPARHYPQIFIQAAEHLDNANLWWLALAAGAYAALRFAEAFGLWFERAWAEWLAAISGGIYLPFEVYELLRGVNALRLTTFLVNVIVVVVMLIALYDRRKARSTQPLI